MTRICQICGKGKLKVSKRKKVRSKYNPTNFYFQKPNLQWFQLSNGKKIKICMKCRKSILKGNIKNPEKYLNEK